MSILSVVTFFTPNIIIGQVVCNTINQNDKSNKPNGYEDNHKGYKPYN